MKVNLCELLPHNKEDFKDHTAIIYDTGFDQHKVTYAQLTIAVEQVQKTLKHHEPGSQVVGVCVDANHHAVGVLLGILYSKASFYYFDASAVEFIKQVIQQLCVHLLILDKKYLPTLDGIIQALGGTVVTNIFLDISDLILVRLTAIQVKHHHGNLAYCITTSGTTGIPKVVRVPHRCIVPNILHIRDLFKLTSDDVVFLTSPLTFDPSVVELFTALSVGAKVVMTQPKVKVIPDKLLEVLFYRNQVTVMQATPTLMCQFDSVTLSQTLLGASSPLRVLSLGGEQYPACSQIRKWRSPENRTVFFNLYGTTEVSCWATYYQLTEEDIRGDSPIPLGLPLANTEVSVLDDSGSVLTEGMGLLLIGGSVRQCILDDDEEAEYDPSTVKLRETGDYVQLLTTGHMVYQGRRDDQLKRNGKRLNLYEISQVLKLLNCVKDSCALMLNNQLKLYVVLCAADDNVMCDCVKTSEPFLGSLLKENLSDTVPEKDVIHRIKQHIIDHLPPQYRPDVVKTGYNMPLTSHGKIDKTRLCKMFTELEREDHMSSEAMSDSLEETWKNVLQLEPSIAIADGDNFLLMGGNSLLAVQLVSALESRLGKQPVELLDWILNRTFVDIKELLNRQEYYSDNKCDEPLVKGLHKDNDIQEIIDVNSHLTNKMRPETTVQTPNTKQAKLDSEYSSTQSDKTTVSEIVDQSKEYSLSQTVNQSQENNLEFIGSVSRGNRQQWNLQRGCNVYHIRHLNKNKKSVDSVQNYDGKTSFDLKRADTTLPVNHGASREQHFSLEQCWKYNTGKCVDASPLLAVDRYGNDVVFIGSHSHRFSAVSMVTGQLLWEVVLGDRVESSACLSSCCAFVIVGCYDGNIYVLKSDTGDIWWTFQTGGEVKSSPVVDMATGLVYVGSHSHSVYALNIVGRECFWKRDLESGSVFSSPVVSQEPRCLYVATLRGRLFSLNMMSGEMNWQYNCRKPLFSSPCLTARGVCIGCVDGCLYHFSPTGQQLWKFATDGPIFSSPSVYQPGISDQNASRMTYEDSHSVAIKKQSENKLLEQNIVFGSHDRSVYCVSNAGVLQWKVTVDSQIYSTPFSCDICCACFRGQCHHKKTLEAGMTATLSTESLHSSDSEIQGCAILHAVSHKKDRKKKSDNIGANRCHQNIHKSLEVCAPQSVNTNWVSNIGEDKHVKKRKKFHGQDISGTKCRSHKCDTPHTFCDNDGLQQHIPKDSSILADIADQSSFSCDTDNLCGREDCREADSCRSAVVFASTGGTLYVVDGRDGRILVSHTLPGEVFSSPLSVHGHIIVGCRDDSVYCLRLQLN